MSKRNNRRSVSTIDRLKPDIKDTVDKMLISGETYRSIVTYLFENGCKLSQDSVSRYARKFLANIQQLRIAQENFRMILSETEKYPELDPAKAILRLLSQKIFDEISRREDIDFEDMAIKDLLQQSIALSKAVTQKEKIDIEIKSKKDIALDEHKTALFEVLKSRHPSLYSQLCEVIKKMKEEDGSYNKKQKEAKNTSY